MTRLRTFLGRHPLWLGFLASFGPLLLLLGLQYRWLESLEKTSAVAHDVSLKNFLDSVGAEVTHFYESNAERALNVPGSVFRPDRLHKAAAYFRKKEIEGARRLFVVLFAEDSWGTVLTYDPREDGMVEAPDDDEARAIKLACGHYRFLALQAIMLESVAPVADERDKEHRIILLPITNEAQNVVGVAGMVLDLEFARSRLLPEVIGRHLYSFFTADMRKNLIVAVRDSGEGVVYATSDLHGRDDEVAAPLPFVFQDWSVAVKSRDLTSKQWARANFTANLSLSVLIAAFLLGGILLALRAAAQEMRLSQMKADFVSNVSHELRTPIASIRVFGEFLRMGRVTNADKIREYGEFIDAEGRRLTQLIDNILDFSRIESGRKSYQFQVQALEPVVEQVVRTFEVMLRHKGFTLGLKRPAVPLPETSIDPAAIGQALHNLLDNAVKYSGDGRDVTVELAREGAFVTVGVTDRGLGIRPEDHAKIFDRFFRVGTGLVHDVRGSGLGLCIVRHIAQAHGGDVRVESELGRGSTFIMRLPAAAAGAPAGSPALIPAAGPAAGGE